MYAHEAVPLDHPLDGDPEYCCDPWDEDGDPGDDDAVHRFHFRPGAPRTPGHLIWCCCKSVLDVIGDYDQEGRS